MYNSRQALAFRHCYKAPLSNLKTTLGKHLFPYRQAFLSQSPLFKVRKVHAVIHRKKKQKADFIIKNTSSGMYEKEPV
jgi:hypothetical protein